MSRISLNGVGPAPTTPPAGPAPKEKPPKPKGPPPEPKPKGPPRAPKPKAKPVDLATRFRLYMTVALGVGIPLLSLAMSKLAGTLASEGMWALAVLAFGLMVSVLGVSLSHLAWAIGNVTRSGKRSSWALAVALDVSLILCELCHVYAGDLGLGWVCYMVMTAVAGASMALNVYAFLMHEPTEPKT